MTEPMDEAAQRALADLDETVPIGAVEQIALWWKKHYTTAGHKRLARILLNKVPTGDKDGA